MATTIYPDRREEEWLQARHLARSTVFPMVLKAAIDLNLLEIIAKANCKLSPIEIACQLPTKNPDAPSKIDRISRALAGHSVLTCDTITTKDGHVQRLYGLTPIAKYFLRNEEGSSLIPELDIFCDKNFHESWYHLKAATLEGDTGMHLFELTAKNDEISWKFNNTMSNLTNTVMKRFLKIYKGFENINQLVDVGGGLGSNLQLIVSKYPQIKGINFDLPRVIADAPHLPGIDHVGGDMFKEVPHGEAIFMKWILHDWGDEQCLKLLKICYNALPHNGNLVVVEGIVPESPTNDFLAKNTLIDDMCMLSVLPDAKERTKKEYETLARKAGFATFELVCCAYG